MNKKKLVLIALFINIILLIGVSYAFFNYDKVSSKSHSVLMGDINLTYNEEQDTLSLTSAFPETDEEARSRDDNYITFSISGKNESKKDIYYEIDLTYGDDVSGRTRIKDENLMFDLIEIDSNNEETYLIEGLRFEDLDNRRIYVATIPASTENTISKNYKLRMWISDGITISDTLADADYTTSEFKNLFASVKVRVFGDFSSKSMETDSTCFTTEEFPTYEVNDNMTTEELNKCVSFLGNTYISWPDGDTKEAFCQETGTLDGLTFKEMLDHYYFTTEDYDYLLDNNIIEFVRNEIQIDEYNDTCEKSVVIPRQIDGKNVTKIGLCSFYSKGLISLVIPDSINEISGVDDCEGTFAYNNLRKIVIPNSLTRLEWGVFSHNQLSSVTIPDTITSIQAMAFSDNKLKNVDIPNSVETISRDAFSFNQLSDISIPASVKSLAGFNNNKITSITIPNTVQEIGYGAFDSNQLTTLTIPEGITKVDGAAFSNNQITNVTIPNTVTILYDFVFENNQLSSVTVPNSVTFIGTKAFAGNKLTNITIGNGITSIGYGAFTKNPISNPNLTSINIDKSCNDVKYNLKYEFVGYDNAYPWLNRYTPYKGAYSRGTTIYGSGGTVCEAF